VPHGLVTGNYAYISQIFSVGGTTGVGMFRVTKIDDYTFTVPTIRSIYGTARLGAVHRGAYRWKHVYVTEVSIREAGTGYAVDDEVTIDAASNTAKFKVTGVDGSGGVTGLSYLSSGAVPFETGINVPLEKYGGSGSGLVVDITGGTAALAWSTVIVIDVDNVPGYQVVVAGVSETSFNGTFSILYQNATYRYLQYRQSNALAGAYGGGGTLSILSGPQPPAAGAVPYYVTIYDPGFVGDSQGNRPAYCETSQAKVGQAGYTYMGTIYVTHTGGAEVLVTCGGWPQQQTYLVNGE
jgi:hypothetical protein